MITKISGTNFGKTNANTFYQYLKNSSNDETFYVSIGYIPDSEYLEYSGSLDSDSVYLGGTDSDFDFNDSLFYSQHTMSYHKVFPGSVSPVVTRRNWTKGVIYDSWPNSNSYVMVRDLEAGFFKINVYLCLFSPRTESIYPPSGTSAEAFVLDNYVWKYLYTITDSQAIKFLDNEWMPVNPRISTTDAESLKPGSDKYNQLIVQRTAEAGRVYDLTVTNNDALDLEIINAGYPNGTTVDLIGRDNSGNTPTADFKVSIVYDSSYGKYTSTLIQKGEGYVGPITMLIDDGSNTEVASISSRVAPLGGFGSNPINELKATNVKVAIRETNENYESAFVNNTPFNLISLVSMPIDLASKKIANRDFYFGCKSFTTKNPNQYTVGEIITKGVSGTSSNTDMIYKIIGVYDNKVYYLNTQQNTEYNVLQDSDTVTLYGSPLKDNVVQRAYDREVMYNSGNILASRYFDEPIYRTKDQIESFNFIINFG